MQSFSPARISLAPRVARCCVLALSPHSASSVQAQVSDRARTLHQDTLVFDAHVHVVNRQFYHGGDMGQRVDDGQFDLARAKEGGLDAMFFSLFVTEQYYPARLETKQVLRLIDAAYDQLAQNKDKIELAFTASDVERISKTGKIAAFMDLEGGFDLDGDLGGAARCSIASGCARSSSRRTTGPTTSPTPAARRRSGTASTIAAAPSIREANRLGMVINISHGSDETIAQAIDVSSDPLLATHHGLRSFNDIPRTMPDDLLKKLAAKGGVIGFQIGNEFHNVKVFNWRTEHAGKPFWDTTDIGRKEAGMTIEELDKLAAPQFPMVGVAAPEDLKFTPYEWLGVVDRAIELVGEDHVMLGSDFDGGPTLPRGMRDIRDLPMLTEAMLKRGWSEQRIRKFLGGNLLRVVRQVTENRQ